MAEKRRHSRQSAGSGKKSRQDRSDDNATMPPSDVYRKPWEALGAWFLGPRAENREKFKELATYIIDEYSNHRESFFPSDPCYITDDMKHTKAYIKEMEDTKEKLETMNHQLTDSIPFFSTRYQGHMTWETTMAASLGYFLGMLWNQNNVDSSASPVTTLFEIQVGQHLCELMGFDPNISSWAHLTGCGSVANLEAMWSARNMKFHPLAMRASCTANIKLRAGLHYPVFVPELNATEELGNCTTWQLLNLDVDTMCSLTEDVNKHICGKNEPDSTVQVIIDKELQKHSVVNVGMHEFCRIHKIGNGVGSEIKAPVVLSPGTNHYSWPKSATVLGLGDQNVIPINVDKNARLDLAYLKNKLEECRRTKTPVIMVVAVIGSTEESAVDPIADMYELRGSCKTEGLNFSLHADAAWGGYLLTMIRGPSQARKQKCVERGEDFVPKIPLSEHAQRQYENLKNADTVTIDPHKAGLCQYPAGALCYRNGTMKGFITLQAPEVFHGEDDVNVGVYGLEGSKPGAAACGVMLSHQVIGLDQMGYGRILGQCQYGTKLFYCMWMTVARDYDNFDCLNMIDLPPIPKKLISPYTDPKEYIREHILGKDNREIYEDESAMKFLSLVGPDALINSFVVNPSGNTNIELCNKLQMKLFDEMNATVGQSPKRIPIFLTTSTLEPEKYGEAVYQLKKRLGFEEHGEEGLGFLRQTCINPFQCSEAFVTTLGDLFRNAVLNSIASMGGEGLEGADEPLHHTFIVVSDVTEDGLVFLDYCPSYADSGSQYHVIVRMKLLSNQENFRSHQKKNPLFLRTKSKMIMYNLLRDYTLDNKDNKKLQFDAIKGKIDGRVINDLSVAMQVEDVFRFNRLESLRASEELNYPEHSKYFLYGDKNNAYMSHVITKHTDFHQNAPAEAFILVKPREEIFLVLLNINKKVVKLDELPHSVPYELLDLGLIATFPDIDGEPLIYDDSIKNPLQCPSYSAEYIGKKYSQCKTSIKISQPGALIWFDAERLNVTDSEDGSKGNGRHTQQRRR